MTIDEKRAKLDYLLEQMAPIRADFDAMVGEMPTESLMMQVAEVLTVVGMYPTDRGVSAARFMKDPNRAAMIYSLASIQAMDLGAKAVARMIQDELNAESQRAKARTTD